jgi:GT2 family glycosyltransferase
MTDLSFSLISMNECDLIDRCISYIRKNVPPSVQYEILLVDNASADGTFETIATKYPEVPIHRNQNNEGFSQNHNLNISKAKGKYVLIMNADVFIKPGFIERLIEALNKYPRAGIACGKLLRADDRTIDSTGHIIFKNRRTIDRGQNEDDKGQYDTSGEVFSACGAAMLCKREMLEDIKFRNEYFDDSFFAYKEDLDLSWRARMRGWKVIYEPKAVATHLRGWGQGKTRKIVPAFIRRHSYKNRYLMMMKNEFPVNLLLAFPFIIWHEIKALVYMLLREQDLFPAWLDMIKLLPLTLKKRKVIMSGAKVSSKEIRKWFK